MAEKKNTQLELFGQQQDCEVKRLARAQRPHYKLTIEQKVELVALYQEGWHPARLSKRFNVKVDAVIKMLRVRNIPIRPRHCVTSLTPEIEAILLTRYEEEGPRALAKELNLPVKRVMNWASERGLKSKKRKLFLSQTRAANNVSVNTQFFEQWSDFMAYALGYIWADGCVYRPEHRSAWTLRLLCVATDDYIIKRIAQEMRSSHKIRYLPARYDAGGKFWSSPSTSISISSKLLIESLVNRHGVLPDKCHKNLPFPSVPAEFLPPFARGYFDGDGTTSLRGRVPLFGLCGSFAFLDGLTSSIAAAVGIRKPAITSDSSIFKTSWCARADVEKIYRWIYPTDGCFCLERKREILAESLKVHSRQIRRRYGNGPRGALWHHLPRKWCVTIANKGVRRYFGYYVKTEEAAFAANLVFHHWYGASAILNTIAEDAISPSRIAEIRLEILEKLLQFDQEG